MRQLATVASILVLAGLVPCASAATVSVTTVANGGTDLTVGQTTTVTVRAALTDSGSSSGIANFQLGFSVDPGVLQLLSFTAGPGVTLLPSGTPDAPPVIGIFFPSTVAGAEVAGVELFTATIKAIDIGSSFAKAAPGSAPLTSFTLYPLTPGEMLEGDFLSFPTFSVTGSAVPLPLSGVAGVVLLVGVGMRRGRRVI